MTSTGRPPQPGRGPRRSDLTPIVNIAAGVCHPGGMVGGAIVLTVAGKGHTNGGGGRPASRRSTLNDSVIQSGVTVTNSNRHPWPALDGLPYMRGNYSVIGLAFPRTGVIVGVHMRESLR